jgi:hypothetical protein
MAKGRWPALRANSTRRQAEKPNVGRHLSLASSRIRTSRSAPRVPCLDMPTDAPLQCAEHAWCCSLVREECVVNLDGSVPPGSPEDNVWPLLDPFHF